MWTEVIFCGHKFTAFVFPKEWGIKAEVPAPSEKHVLASIDPDSPNRWVLLAEPVENPPS